MRLGSRNKQEVIPTRRQQRLELRPVADVAQFLGKKSGHVADPPTSPIEDVSFVPIAPITPSRKVIPENSVNRVQQLALPSTP
jgi:hypothetical protein